MPSETNFEAAAKMPSSDSIISGRGPTSGSNMVTLISMDKVRFAVEASTMLECKLLRAMVDGERER